MGWAPRWPWHGVCPVPSSRSSRRLCPPVPGPALPPPCAHPVVRTNLPVAPSLRVAILFFS